MRNSIRDLDISPDQLSDLKNVMMAGDKLGLEITSDGREFCIKCDRDKWPNLGRDDTIVTGSFVELCHFIGGAGWLLGGLIDLNAVTQDQIDVCASDLKMMQVLRANERDERGDNYDDIPF